eukprot:TRINITY_DN4071_c0_g2_i1.p1 TRINITY_DN4071_c0_g2~~TRINITY_DN4071_c0_g2_i1.p1  ORF type:complete len:262 (-),score=40.99 TRINITY_DN4071_c0_g2_i1:10-795(-)
MKAWASPRETPSPDASTCSPSVEVGSSNRSSSGLDDAAESPVLFLSRRCWDLESSLMAVRVITAWRLALESGRREEAEAEAMQLNTEVSLLQAQLDSIMGFSHQPAEKPAFQFSSVVKKPSQAVTRCVSTVVLNQVPATAEKLDRKTGVGGMNKSASCGTGGAPKQAMNAVPVAVAVPVHMPRRQDSRAMELERWRAAGRPNCTRAGSASSSRTDEGRGAGYSTRGRCTPSPARVETSLRFGSAQQKAQPLRRRLGFEDVR